MSNINTGNWATMESKILKQRLGKLDQNYKASAKCWETCQKLHDKDKPGKNTAKW